MKKLFIATSIAFCLSTNVALAKNQTVSEKSKTTDEQKTQMIGFGSGMLSGALVGGPIGAVIGGIFGVLIAEDVNNDTVIKASKQDLQSVRGQLSAEKYENQRLESLLLAMEKQQVTHLASFDSHSEQAFLDQVVNFETRLMFKTASYSIEDIYKEQLNNLAAILREYPQLKINVTGYADTRGDKQYNQLLSEQRAKAVKDYLISKQVKAQQMEVEGAGELVTKSEMLTFNDKATSSQLDLTTLSSDLSSRIVATDTNAKKIQLSNIEDLFFARKVNIRFVTDSSQMTAAK